MPLFRGCGLIRRMGHKVESENVLYRLDIGIVITFVCEVLKRERKKGKILES